MHLTGECQIYEAKSNRIPRRNEPRLDMGLHHCPIKNGEFQQAENQKVQI